MPGGQGEECTSSVLSYLFEPSASALQSASAFRSTHPSRALSAPFPSPQARASSSRSPAALWRRSTENSHHTKAYDQLLHIKNIHYQNSQENS